MNLVLLEFTTPEEIKPLLLLIYDSISLDETLREWVNILVDYVKINVNTYKTIT